MFPQPVGLTRIRELGCVKCLPCSSSSRSSSGALAPLAGGTFFSIGKRMWETSGPDFCRRSPDHWFPVGSQRAPVPPAARFFPSENGCGKPVVRMSAVEARTTGFLWALNGHPSRRRHVFFHRKTDAGNKWSGFLPWKPGPLVFCGLSTGTAYTPSLLLRCKMIQLKVS